LPITVDRFRYIQPLWIACHWLAMSNCCYNPIVYCWMNDKFRNGFRYAFGWCPCVQRPDVPPAMIGSEWAGGRPTMYGGMRLSEVATRATAGDRVRGSPAATLQVSFSGSPVGRSSSQRSATTEVLGDPSPSSSRRPASGGQLRLSELKKRREHGRREKRNEQESVSDSS